MLPNLPIGRQDFHKIRTAGDLYVDKTEHIHRLITGGGGYYFLARPRRFGKSLTLSTIKELYSGSRELFKGLWVEDHWDWNKTAPVIHLQFNEINYVNQSLEAGLKDALLRVYAAYGLSSSETILSDLFKDLLRQLAAAHGRVVLLIDEYDKPLIDFLTKEKLPQAFENQAVLKSFYSVIKSSDNLIEFLLITGVSKFSKVGVFSDLNNLYDITLHPRFATLTGITQEELELHFGAAIDAHEAETGKTDLRGKLRTWYNGYSFHGGKDRVYNPFSILSFFGSWEFRNFWFSTGTPTFLIDLLRERHYYRFEQVEMGPSAFESYQLDRLETIPLLFQTGYLTIKEYDPEYQLYTLDYPNKEVKDSMLQYLVAAFRHGNVYETTPAVVRLAKAFDAGDLEAVREQINDLFQTIPHQLFVAAKENLYHALIHLLFTYLGQYIQSEVNTLRGRIDSVVETDDHVYVLEFKLDGSAEAALAQIQERGYLEAKRSAGKKVVAIGVNFSSSEKGITGWAVAK